MNPDDQIFEVILLYDPNSTVSAEESQQFCEQVQAALPASAQARQVRFSNAPLFEAIATCAALNPLHLVIVPLSIYLPSMISSNQLEDARNRWPRISIALADPQAQANQVVLALADQAAGQAIVLVSTHRYAALNAELARIAYLAADQYQLPYAGIALFEHPRYSLANTIHQAQQLGIDSLKIIPCSYFAPSIVLPETTSIQLEICPPIGQHARLIGELVERYKAATALQADTGSHHHGDGRWHSHGQVQVPSFLPPRYQANPNVSAAPMGAAGLVYDEQGLVAWDRIWGGDDPNNPFCELALAGGPPHRGDLLEPVNPEDVRQRYGEYTQVVLELIRAIKLTTGLNAKLAKSDGWLGVECESEEMAIWLLRAIIVENVIARREESTLFLPAGPDFRLEYEIKNVVTALAKTHHYWKEHLMAQ